MINYTGDDAVMYKQTKSAEKEKGSLCATKNGVDVTIRAYLEAAAHTDS
jgi:hypothetical protein